MHSTERKSGTLSGKGRINMSKYKVAVYAICKNEEHFVDRWMDSMGEADVVLVCDTGSTDNTVEKLEAKGAVVYRIKVNPWRFDVPRNASLALLPSDVDICVCTDLDEIFEKGWREKLERAWQPDTNSLRYQFTYRFNPDGTRAVTYWKEKIHARINYRWVNPIHEVISYYGDTPEKIVYAHEIYLDHFPVYKSSRGQYLPLLEQSAKENPDNDRNVHYLGREYMYYGMWDKCIETLNKHLEMPSATWKDERCASLRFISRSYKGKGQPDVAKQWLYKAIAEAPYLREPYVDMARLMYEAADWPGLFHMVKDALNISNKPETYLNEASSWDYTLYDFGAISAYRLGLYKEAEEFAQIACDMEPHDERLKKNLLIISEKRQVLKGT